MTELRPKSLKEEEEEDAQYNNIGSNKITKAKQIEASYDNLNSIATNDMMMQQKQLMENMKNIEPLLNTAQSFLDKLESSSIGKMIERMPNIPGMSNLFGSQKALAAPAAAQ